MGARGQRRPRRHLVRADGESTRDPLPKQVAAHAADASNLAEARESVSGLREQGAALATKVKEGEEKLKALAARMAAANGEIDASRNALAEARTALAEAQSRADLAQVQVATLTSKLNAKYVASVAWDAEHQAGILRVSQLPESAAEKAYQLWVIDGATEKPVSAGVFQINPDGSAR